MCALQPAVFKKLTSTGDINDIAVFLSFEDSASF